jgi:hypothetical protein
LALSLKVFMRKELSFFFVLATASVGICTAQDLPKDDGAVATQRANAASPLKEASVRLPEGKGAWVARVIRTGGFSGSPLDVTLTSQGALSCENTTCPKVVSADTLQAMNPAFDPKSIASAKSTLSDLCQSCFVTRLTVKHRDSGGKVHTHFVFWDDVTAARAPAELVKLARELVSLSK